MKRILITCLLVACLTASSIGFPQNHTFTVTHPLNTETTIVAVEVRNATRVSAHNWIERATSPSTSLDITVTRPSLLVAMWWGNGPSGTHTATPSNGFTTIESFTLDGEVIQCTVAVKSVTAGTYNVTWTSGTGEGAQLWMVAVDAPVASGAPSLGGHALAWDPIGSGGTETTTAGITTNPSEGAGSVILVAAGHQTVSLATPPSDSEGNIFTQLGSSHTYTDFPNAGTALYATFPPASQKRPPFDFDGDRKTDIGIFRPVGAVSEWWINRSSTGITFALQFGSSTDRITPADYTGDGKADIAFFRPSSGEWYVLRSENFSFFALPFGTNGDVPVPADYDADGKADFAVFRPSSSTWFVSQSSGAPTRIVQFGTAGDQPVVADYDGDGKADIAIFRNAGGASQWWIERSMAGSLALQFGAATDKAVQGDYTGDGKADVAIWRPSTGEWFIIRSEDLSFYGFPFGESTDIPAPGDYDGDGKFDPTVFRPSSATWFIARTTAGTQIVQFGATGDRPISNAFIP